MARKKLRVFLFKRFKKAVLHILKCAGCLIFIFVLLNKANAQIAKNKVSVYGIIKDKVSGEALPYANIVIFSSKQVSISNDYGFYSISTAEGEIAIKCTYVGYETYLNKFRATKDTLLNIFLRPSAKQLEEIVVTDTLEESSLNSQISIKNIPIKKAKQLPVILGEVDLLKTVQLMPGIQSGHEGSSGVYVRGGSGDQNLYIIDGTPVYSVMHLLGFISIFNEDAVSSMKIYTGGFPARFHGRLSSVVDIKTKEGNLYKYKGGLSIGLLSAKFDFNGPIMKSKSSFFISGRRSYFDLLARPVIKELADGAVVKLNYYDLNAKANFNLSKKDHLYFSAYFGNDKYSKILNQSYNNQGVTYNEQNNDGLVWGNLVSSLRWNHIWNSRLFTKFSVSYTRFKYINEKYYSNSFEGFASEYNYQFKSGINDLSSQFSMDYYPNKYHDIKAGVSFVYHTYIPGITLEDNSQTGEMISRKDTTFGYDNIYNHEINVFIEDSWKINDKLIVKPGVSTTFYKSSDKLFSIAEPRLTFNYFLANNLVLKAGYARMSQFMHLLRFSTINLPTDLWIPSNANLPPEISNQFTVGVSHKFKSIFDLSVEAYYKNMNNVTEYKEGTSLFRGSSNFKEYIEVGKGWSYGIEFMIKKQYGRLNGWISYTLSKSVRQFKSINMGKPFPFRFDRRHDLSLTASYQINKKIDAGLNWVYGSGYPVTMHTDKYASYFLSVLGGNSVVGPYNFAQVDYYPYRNNYRMPSFHHLDVNFNFHKSTKYGERVFSVGVYNVYNRLNAFYLEEKNGRLYKVSLFPIMPFIRFTLRFL